MKGQGKDAAAEQLMEMLAQHGHQKTMRCPHCGSPMRLQPNQRGAPSNQHKNKTHEDARSIAGVPMRGKDRYGEPQENKRSHLERHKGFNE
jgi:hypothetical protein